MTPAAQAGPSRGIALLLAGQAVVTTGLMTLVPIMPLYLRDLAGPDAAHWSSLALAAPGVGALLLAPFAGSWCERWGYRRPLLLSLSAFTASLLLMGLSTHVAGFMAGRLLQGASAVGVLLTICIGRLSTPGMRGRAFGMQESAVAIGALLGPVLGGVLQDWWTVRPMLLAVAGANAVLTLLLAWRLREPVPQAPASADTPRGFAAMLADASLRRWLLAGCLTQAGAFALVNVFALYLQERYPHDAMLGSKTGFLHALGWLAALLASPLWGALNDRGTAVRAFMLAAGGCALALALLPLADALWQIGALRIVQGALFAALAQSMLSYCCARLPTNLHGSATGIARSAMTAGQLVGPLAVMAWLPRTGPAGTLWLIAAMFALAAALVVPDRSSLFATVPDAR
ncbi:MFS transporter [Cupriavidus necator]|uniref:MFS transporter n=1 Tax=Cupriavidus necator TaxID=106590 RepID=A0A1U9UMI6_CUPNE|nr:MFS transporter [Cupriavidus necator]AQV93892.1 MFS transporter [Cupriavidus necator]